MKHEEVSCSRCGKGWTPESSFNTLYHYLEQIDRLDDMADFLEEHGGPYCGDCLIAIWESCNYIYS